VLFIPPRWIPALGQPFCDVVKVETERRKQEGKDKEGRNGMGKASPFWTRLMPSKHLRWLLVH